MTSTADEEKTNGAQSQAAVGRQNKWYSSTKEMLPVKLFISILAYAFIILTSCTIPQTIIYDVPPDPHK